MKIAIIDSGINGILFKNIRIDQYNVKDGIVSREDAVDNTGHGTSVTGIIVRQIVGDIQILSLRPIIENEQLSNKDLAEAVLFAVDQGAAIINISMGTEELKSRKCLEF